MIADIEPQVMMCTLTYLQDFWISICTMQLLLNARYSVCTCLCVCRSCVRVCVGGGGSNYHLMQLRSVHGSFLLIDHDELHSGGSRDKSGKKVLMRNWEGGGVLL